ncbi:MAG: hypothetical protein CFH12_00595 [Alphaproteobacteria bacterium MarineAlpha5_Bin2]|jgi:hypothetical protein|nr:DUF1192 domain-containing protein [Alphaproteobacteria bacterium]MEC7745311.1 DUF1192 family protein [Pseudomonadota bacterium]PPR53582.1 MAG: hypothetical protein CFH11_00429 [Alphaproteobacteria bacterium MarineAlpha5_Bin1]PPR54070.1 MAG: hypothetical protein CFH12_00595 [Alphaproteobacteria bacterium MarineAlpha5_Bin2]PPR57515.1 MAG: hypothetical protein CFH13_00012 [Alphaproteobacteria bacterium MarineAlpha5_Bin3]HIA60647.1 DUF1192 family protein [Pelagibacterales bacterium]|tara:strand:- start:597 stop:779 length:183 start_codon:yes stop_codon:yes gene_type:complete
MNSFLEFEEDKKTIKSINLDNFSIEDLEEYIDGLKLEVKKAEEEIKQRIKTKGEAQKFFK